MPALDRSERNDREFATLLSEITRARASLREGRERPPTHLTRYEQERLCEELLQALEAYAHTAALARVPLPYRLRDEIRLYRALYPGIPRHPGLAP